MFLTDGAISPDGGQVALRSYTSLYLFDAEAFSPEGTDGDPGVGLSAAAAAAGRDARLPPMTRACWSAAKGVDQPIYLIGLPRTSELKRAASTAPRPTTSQLVVVGSWGLAAILLVSVVAALVMRARAR